MAPRKAKIGIKSGAERAYEYLLDKPVGYHISEVTHSVHVPLHTGKLSGALASLEKYGVVEAIGRTRAASLSGSGRRARHMVFRWLGAKPDIKFAPGMRPGVKRTSTCERKPSVRRRLDLISDIPSDTVSARAARKPAEEARPAPQMGGLLILPPRSDTPQVLPAQPTLSEQLLLLAIRIDRARKAGTPSQVFKSAASVQAVALPHRSEIVEKLLELATLAEQLERDLAIPRPDLEPLETYRY